jgi:polygalacturonase
MKNAGWEADKSKIYRPDERRRSMLGIGGMSALAFGALALSNSKEAHATTASAFYLNVQDPTYGAVGDGLSNDTTAIQAAFTAASTLGVRVVVIPRTANWYKITSSLVVPSNVVVYLLGTLKLASGSTNAQILNLGSNVSILGPGTVDCSNVAGTAGIYASGSTNIYIRDITSTNAANWPVNIAACTNVTLEDCTFSNSGASAEFAGASTNCWAIRCQIYGINDQGFAFYGGVTDSGIVDSLSYNNNYTGIALLSDQYQSAPCKRILISNNICHDNMASGIEIGNAPGAAGNHSDVSVVGNVLHNNSKNPTFASALGVFNVNRALVSNNQIYNDGASSSQTFGIGVAACSTVMISNNDIHNTGQGGTSGIGIYVVAGVSSIVISGNFIYDDQATKTMASAIGGTATSKVTVVNNILGSTIGAAITLPTGSGNYFFNNPTIVTP